MKSKYFIKKAIRNFNKNFLKYLSVTACTIIVLLVFYVISALILSSNDIFESTWGFIVFLVTTLILCLLLNPILEAFVFSVDVTEEDEEATVIGKDGKEKKVKLGNSATYFQNFKFGIRVKLNSQNRGSVKVFWNIIRSVLIYLIVFLVCELISIACLNYSNPEAADILNIYMNGGTLTQAEVELLNDALETPLLVSNFVALLLSFISYFYFLFIYLFKSSVGNAYPMIYKQSRLNAVDETYKANRSVFIKPYLVIGGIVLFVFAVIFAVAYFLLYYYTPVNNFVIITETALFIGILIMLLFVPCLFELYRMLGTTFAVYFEMNFVPYTDKIMKEIEHNHSANRNNNQKVEQVKKVYQNDLHLVCQYGHFYYLQWCAEVDGLEAHHLDEYIDKVEVARIKEYMETNETIKRETENTTSDDDDLREEFEEAMDEFLDHNNHDDDNDNDKSD